MIEFTIEELQHMMIIMHGENPYCGVCESIRLKLEAMIKDKIKNKDDAQLRRL